MGHCMCGCGREIPDRTKDGRARHYARGHGKGVRVATICAECSAAITVERWRLERMENVFCSAACSGAHKRRFAVHHCEVCGVTFTVKASRKQGARIFCSYRCSVRGRRPKAMETVKCSGCGQTFERWKPANRIASHRYCSRACRALKITGAGNPSYTSGSGRRINYGPHWRAIRRAVRARDRNCCQKCGAAWSGPRSLHVHHKVDARTFGEDYEAMNALENLVTLCVTCHLSR